MTPAWQIFYGNLLSSVQIKCSWSLLHSFAARMHGWQASLNIYENSPLHAQIWDTTLIEEKCHVGTFNPFNPDNFVKTSSYFWENTYENFRFLKLQCCKKVLIDMASCPLCGMNFNQICLLNCFYACLKFSVQLTVIVTKIKISPVRDSRSTPFEWLSSSCDLDLDPVSGHTAYRHASVIDLYLHSEP